MDRGGRLAAFRCPVDMAHDWRRGTCYNKHEMRCIYASQCRFFVFFAVLLTLAGLLSVPFPHPVRAADADISKQIDAKNQELKQLQAEAQQYQAMLSDIGTKANTLQSQIQTYDRTIASIKANIRVTQTKISLTNLQIKQLGTDIHAKEVSIETERQRLGHFLSLLAESDQETAVEILMKNPSVSSFFTSLDEIKNVQQSIQSLLAQLRSDREDLKNRKSEAEQKKLELLALSRDLADQKTLQEYERTARANLLKETKNEERRYQQLLATNEQKRSGLEREINNLEAGLPSFDRSLIPKAGVGIIGWPLPDPIFITQYFGNTAFARSGAYSGKGHNGVDFRAANLTPVFAADGGVVRATGDTDSSCPKASYGRWILIDHVNNLSTLYGHLTLIKVSPGDAVNRGDLIGYSGHTGYATGPHLHLSVFVRQAVQVGQLRSRVCGTIMTLPLSPFGGYLNPLDYLPSN